MRICFVILPVLYTACDFVVAKVVTEQLANISGLPVCIRPQVVLGVPAWCFLLLTLFVLLFRRRLLPLTFCAIGFRLVFLLLLLLRLFDFFLRRFEFIRFPFSSKIDATSNWADVANNAEELIH